MLHVQTHFGVCQPLTLLLGIRSVSPMSTVSSSRSDPLRLPGLEATSCSGLWSSSQDEQCAISKGKGTMVMWDGLSCESMVNKSRKERAKERERASERERERKRERKKKREERERCTHKENGQGKVPLFGAYCSAACANSRNRSSTTCITYNRNLCGTHSSLRLSYPPNP